MHPTENKVSTSKLDSDPIFDHIKEHIKTHPERAKSFNAVVLFKISKNGKIVKNWTLDLKAGELYVGEPKNGKIDTEVTISDEDIVQIILAKINPLQAFMEDKFQLTGNHLYMHKIWILLRTSSTAKL